MGGFVGVALAAVVQIQHPTRAECVHYFVFRGCSLRVAEDFPDNLSALFQNDGEIQGISYPLLHLFLRCLQRIQLHAGEAVNSGGMEILQHILRIGFHERPQD